MLISCFVLYRCFWSHGSHVGSMEPVEEAEAPAAPAETNLGTEKVAAAVAIKQGTPGKSAALPPKSPHSKPAPTAGNTSAKNKSAAHASEQSGHAANRLKRDLNFANELTGANASGTQQPSAHTTPAKPAKRPKTGSKTSSASPSGPASSPGDFLKKLSAYIQELGGEELDPGWEVDVCSPSVALCNKLPLACTCSMFGDVKWYSAMFPTTCSCRCILQSKHQPSGTARLV